ncbi:MAG TPA: Tex-like N-terminal domain-containing protein, partial [Blastocatellia bacterium]|nr:Tex-like N-terminal domain-containing protein [Blastocatellia bacterium]
MTFETWFQSIHPEIPFASANAVLTLTEEGGTIPFIARYRKEQTGNLDEVAIQHVIDGKERWDEIIKRQTFIVEEIERQGKLTEELKEKILATFNLDSLEDIYLPYKQKRKTKATVAKEAGLEPLANWIWDVAHGAAKPEAGQTLEAFALAFYNPEKNINDTAAAITGAQDILTER